MLLNRYHITYIAGNKMYRGIASDLLTSMLKEDCSTAFSKSNVLATLTPPPLVADDTLTQVQWLKGWLTVSCGMGAWPTWLPCGHTYSALESSEQSYPEAEEQEIVLIMS